MATPATERRTPSGAPGIPLGGVVALVVLSILLAAAVAVIARSDAEIAAVVGVPLGWYLGPPEIRALQGDPMAVERLLGRLLSVPLSVVVGMALAVGFLLVGVWPLWVVGSIAGVGLGVVGGFLARILLRLRWVTTPSSAP